MARFYQTSTPTDVDFVRKTPSEFLQLVAEQDALNAGQTSLLNSIDSAYNFDVFEGTKSIVEDHRKQTQDEINELTQMVMKDGRTPEFLARVSDLGNRVANFRHQGLGSKLNVSYNNMIATAKRMKDEGISEDRIQDYLNAVNVDAYNFTNKYNINPQESFKDLSTGRQAFAEFDHNTFLNDNVKPENNEVTYQNATVDEEGNIISSLPQLRKSGISFTYRLDDITKEGYNIGAIERSSYINLLQNQDFVQDLQHQFNYRNPRKADGSFYEKTPEGFEEFLKREAEIKAATHASKFAGEDKTTIKTTFETDDYLLQNQLLKDKDALERKRKEDELVEKARMNGILDTAKQKAKQTMTINERQTLYENAQETLKNLEKRYKDVTSWSNKKLSPEALKTLEEQINLARVAVDREKIARNSTFNKTLERIPEGSDAYYELLDLKLKAQSEGKVFDYDYFEENKGSKKTISRPVDYGRNRGIDFVTDISNPTFNLEKVIEEAEPIQLETSSLVYKAGNQDSDQLLSKTFNPNFLEGFPSVPLVNSNGETLTYKNKPLTYGVIVSGLNDETFKFTSNVEISSGNKAKVGIDLGDGQQVFVDYSYDGLAQSLKVVSETVGDSDLQTQRVINQLLKGGTDLDFIENLHTNVQRGSYDVGSEILNSNFKLNDQDQYGVDIKVIAKSNTDIDATSGFDSDKADYYVTTPLGLSRKVDPIELLSVVQTYSELNYIMPKARSLNLELGKEALIPGPNGYPYKVKNVGENEDGTPILNYFRIPNISNEELKSLDATQKTIILAQAKNPLKLD